MNKAKFGKKMGVGKNPALLIIDVQNYMIGPVEGSNDNYPSACGDTAHRALEPISKVLSTAHEQSIPVIYTKFQLRADGKDIGVYGEKRDFMNIDSWCIEGTFGAEISQCISPGVDDFVLTKKKPSAFFGTSLLSILIDHKIDTLLLVGGATSNCVRATAVDSMSYNFKTIVIEDCVFDRIDISHKVALFDLGRQYADLMNNKDVIEYLNYLT